MKIHQPSLFSPKLFRAKLNKICLTLGSQTFLKNKVVKYPYFKMNVVGYDKKKS